MEPLTLIVSALAAGATAALKETAGQAIKDGYNALKSRVLEKFPDTKIGLLEEEPEEETYQAVVRKNIADSDANPDQELLDAAKQLFELFSDNDPSVLQSFGVDLENVHSTGTGFRGKDLEKYSWTCPSQKGRFRSAEAGSHRNDNILSDLKLALAMSPFPLK